MQQFNYEGVPCSAGHPVIASQEALCSMNLTLQSDAVVTLVNNGGCTGQLLQQLEQRLSACHYRSQSAKNLNLPAAKYNLYQRRTFRASHTLFRTLTKTVSSSVYDKRGPGSVVGIGTGYGLDGPGIESP